MSAKNVARLILATQRELQQIDSRRARASRVRPRLTVPRRRWDRRHIPAWSPRSQAERRPMRVMRHARDLW
ncbi:MAG TPA: hypothetical protein VKZ96_09775 [Thermomicrobiales bacterium]|nr:hypothetical protein [Thermomicrobiales bacterium]